MSAAPGTPIVGLVSSYREGPLLGEAVASLLAADVDRVYVFEGPAGTAPIDTEACPPSDLDGLHPDAVTVVQGTWSTDAKKRTAMVRQVNRDYTGPVWGVWLDGDELLMNGQHLRAWLRVLDWRDELAPEDEAPTLGWPIKLVELDGSVAVCRAKVVRIDLIASYSVSSSVFLTVIGTEHGEGNLPFDFNRWERDRLGGMERGWLYLPPPLPAEPHLLHRSALRHPLRQGVRMHVQERDELQKRGLI